MSEDVLRTFIEEISDDHIEDMSWQEIQQLAQRFLQDHPAEPHRLQKYTHSVLQDWVMDLPLREQGTVLTAVRGCDLTPKLPLDALERQLVGFIRFCILNPADPREVDVPGAFFQSRMPQDWKASELGHYPLHWYSHVMHTLEVIGYRHPHPKLADTALRAYFRMATSLHLHPESKDEMIARLSEDRIATGTVVS